MPYPKLHQTVILAFIGIFSSFSACYGGVSFSKHPLEIITPTATYRLMVEVATTQQQLEHGLMFRKKLAKNSGMLFVFPDSAQITMWMKNTYIPLDMLFIDAQGTIKNIVENAPPLSEAYIHSDGKVKMVLEIAAGSVKTWGVRANDKVVFTQHTLH